MANLSILSMIDFSVATHTNGFAFWLYSRVNAWMQRARLVTLVKLPRLMARWLIRPNQCSTWLIQDAYVGVKCTWKRGRLASQARTLAC